MEIRNPLHHPQQIRGKISTFKNYHISGKFLVLLALSTYETLTAATLNIKILDNVKIRSQHNDMLPSWCKIPT